jgi:protein FAM32A
MSTFTGGKLKLKGTAGVVKKKKKKKTATDTEETHLAVAQDGAAPADGAAEQLDAGGSAPAAVEEDRRTEAEKRHDAALRKLEETRLKKAAVKSHRERIKELNDKLATLTEHHDIPRISYSYM